MGNCYIRKVFPSFFFFLTLYVLHAVLPCEQFTSNPIVFTKKDERALQCVLLD